MASSASVTRALNAILPLIASGQAYEAHQKARTFASRYSKSGQFDTAIQVLFQSAKELLKAGHQGSGTDLATFLIEVYETKGEEISEESRGGDFLSFPFRCLLNVGFWETHFGIALERITQLIALTGPGGGWRKTIIDRSVAYVLANLPSSDPSVTILASHFLLSSLDGRQRKDHGQLGTRISSTTLVICFTKVGSCVSGFDSLGALDADRFSETLTVH